VIVFLFVVVEQVINEPWEDSSMVRSGGNTGVIGHHEKRNDKKYDKKNNKTIKKNTLLFLIYC